MDRLSRAIHVIDFLPTAQFNEAHIYKIASGYLTNKNAILSIASFDIFLLFTD